MDYIIYYLAIVWFMIVSAVILFMIALWAYSVWGKIKITLKNEKECVHPYSSVIGDESGCPECLMCGEKLNK